MSYFSRLKPIYTVSSKLIFQTPKITSKFISLEHIRYMSVLPFSWKSLRQHCPNLTCLREMSKNSNASAVDENLQQKALDNDEFRDILNDFARDFEVNEESAKVLEDIKNNQDPAESDDTVSADNDSRDGKSSETKTAFHSLAQGGYTEFKDIDASVIYDTEEESQLDIGEEFFHIDQEYENKVTELHAKRGVTGVFDIDELVDLLRNENMFDIAVINIPTSASYVDYIVVANAKSPRHAKAVSEFVVKCYKLKKNKEDPFVIIEGEKIASWKAIDLGNIALHIFLEDTRVCYDIESLWLLDREYDSGGQVQQDDFIDVLQDELEFLNSVKSNEILTADTELNK